MQTATVQIAEKMGQASAAAPFLKRSAPSLGTIISDPHKSVCRMLGYCLTANTPKAWQRFGRLLLLRLEPGPQFGLAFGTLRTLPPDARLAAFELAHWGETGGAGAPLPPFGNVSGEARSWAARASLRERKTYLLAIYETLSLKDQSGFCAYITRGSA